MSILLIAWLTAVASTNQFPTVTNSLPKPLVRSTNIVTAPDPLEIEFQKLLEADDAAQTEAERWIQEANSPGPRSSPSLRTTLELRIDQRLQPVRKAYEDFLRSHPDHARARLAFGSFLNDIEKEEEAVVQWEKAKELDPANPAVWNNLANHYGHRGPIVKAFAYYEKALELSPNEPVYLQNLATTTYVFRTDAIEYYKCTEPEVFDRALNLYRRALKLDPKNFPLAADYAQSYYGIKPLRAKEAIEAWTQALEIAPEASDREGVYLHLARVELNSGLFDSARQHLDMVTNEMHLQLKLRLERNLTDKRQATQTNTPPNIAPSK